MSLRPNPAAQERGGNHSPPASGVGFPDPPRPAPRRSRDLVLDHYLRRVDPTIAASFSAEQRAAIKSMLGGRGLTRHTVEIRRSLPFGRRRIYLVLLMGAERRTLARLQSEGMMSRYFTTIVYFAVSALALASLAGLLAIAG